MRILFLLSLILVLAACSTPASTPPAPKSEQVTKSAPTAEPKSTQVEKSAPTAPSKSERVEKNAPPSTATTAPATAVAPGTIPPSFFGMTAIKPADYPRVTFGTLGHPGIGAWAWIERQKGVYDFTLIDGFVNDAVKHGLGDATNTVSMAITLGTTPQWYASNPNSCFFNPNGGVRQCTSSPTNLEDWSRFLTAVMKHYNGIAMPHIRYYELWNEANIDMYWTGSTAEMVNLAKVAYPIIHADSHSLLLTPSVANTVGDLSPASGTTWMAGYLDAGGARYADGGAFHGYIAATGIKPYPMPEQDSTSGCVKFRGCYGSIITKATMLRQVFDQYGLAGKPMFDTEGSWGEGNVTDPDTQAAWLARWYLLQAGLYSTDNLQVVIWFAWDETSFNWGSIEDASGEPTQAGIAFNQIYDWLVGAAITQPCASAPDGTWTCTLTRPGGYSALAVWNTQGSKPYLPGATYADYRDLAGKTVKIVKGAPVTIGAKPILLETALPAQGSP